MNLDRRTRMGLGIALIAATSLVSNLQLLKKAIAIHRHDGEQEPMGLSEAVASYEKRLEGLKKILPSNAHVGYVSDWEKSDTDFLLTQYTLAPAVVSRNPDHPLVVGNFLGTNAPDRIGLAPTLVPLQDFGGGVVLFRREAK